MIRNFKKEIFILSAVGLASLGGWAWNALNPQKPSAQAQTKKTKPALLKDKDVDHFTDNCLAPRGKFLEKVGVVKQYTVVAFTYDFDQPVPIPDVPEGIKVSPSFGKDMHQVPTDHAHSHATRFKVPEPNLDFALMRVDPTLGCKPTIKSIRSEPLVAFDKFVRVKIQKLRWAYLGATLEQKHGADLQDYLTERLTTTGPFQMGLDDESVLALNSMKIKLPKWFDLKLTQQERDKEYYRFITDRPKS